MTSLPADSLINISTENNLSPEFHIASAPILGAFATAENINLSVGNVPSSNKIRNKHRRSKSRQTTRGRGSLKASLEENAKLRQELEAMEIVLGEFRAEMPSMYDDLEDKTNEIRYLRNALDASQNKCQGLTDRLQRVELTMSWNDENMQEQLQLITDETNVEVEGIKDRLYKEVNRLSQELANEIRERSQLVNDHVQVKQQLNKLRKERDDEREAYLLNISNLERASRSATKEKNRYRIEMENMREKIFSLESELDKQKDMVLEQKQLIQTQREELHRAHNSSADVEESAVSKTVFTGNLAMELSSSENVINQLRQEKMDVEDELADCREHLHNTLETMEYAVGAIAPNSGSGEGVFQLEKAIGNTRDYLGLQPLVEDDPAPESYQDDVSLFNDHNLILESKEIGIGLDEVDLGDIEKVPVLKPDTSPSYAQMEEFKQEVVNEVTKIKQDILTQFTRLAEDTLRSNVVENSLWDTIQKSTLDSSKTVIEWLEIARKTSVDAFENISEIDKIKTAAQISLEDQQTKYKVIVDKLRRKVASLELALKNSSTEVTKLRNCQKQILEQRRLQKGIDSGSVDDSKVAEKEMDILVDDNISKRIHSLDSLGVLTMIERRNRVTSFLEIYSDASAWKTVRDSRLHTTLYMFQFDGSRWKTRISFLYPFVNYMAQVIGVDKKALGPIFVILPTSTVGIKIKRLSGSFDQIRRTLETHNSEDLWSYIFIFLKNLSTHYGHIKRYVGSRTRTSTNSRRRNFARSGTDRSLLSEQVANQGGRYHPGITNQHIAFSTEFKNDGVLAANYGG